MCNHCYHVHGRNGKATNCEHTERANYAKGLCQPCYHLQYNREKRLKKR